MKLIYNTNEIYTLYNSNGKLHNTYEKLYNTKEKLYMYNTNGKDGILQRFTCHIRECYKVVYILTMKSIGNQRIDSFVLNYLGNCHV